MYSEPLNQFQETFNLFQGPLHEIMELNMKTIQNISYLKPDELANLKNPQEVFEKHINVLIDNSHKSLNYLQKATEIFEKNLLMGSNKLHENAENFMKQTKKATQENRRKGSK